MVGCQLTLFSKPVSLLHIINTGATEKGVASATKEVVLFLGYFFYWKKFALILKKMCWATFWAIFSQTHLVTLSTMNVQLGRGEEEEKS
jgi:hypothetical protein